MDLTHGQLLGLGPGDNSNFDFDAFLREDAIEYLDMSAPGNMSSGTVSPPSPPNGSTMAVGFLTAGTGASSASSSSAQASEVARRNTRLRNERRGHTKSRRGCYNCKRRRIKCQETRPKCGHCDKTGLQCEYPSTPQIVHQPHHQVPLFSLQDMRFFQHFLLKSYPAHPVGNENTWTHTIPCLSHEHDFLMHSILACSASDLYRSDKSQDIILSAMTHRYRAIRAIKKRLAEMPRQGTTYEEANAILATCFALTFQSTAIEDGAPEYMTFIRGVVIVTIQMFLKGIRPVFTNLEGADTDAILAPKMEALPLIDLEWSQMAIAGVEGLAPLCAGADEDGLMLEYHDMLLQWARKLQESSLGAYRALRKQYGWWMMQPHMRFSRLIDMEDQVIVLLTAHWVALHMIMVFVLQLEQSARQKTPSEENRTVDQIDVGMGRWLRALNPMVEPAYQSYNTFPMWVQEQLDRDTTFFGKTY